MDINCLAIDGQVCFHRWPFADPVKLGWCITWPVGPLGSTNQNWLCTKLLPMAVSIYPVACVHSCRLLGTHHYCLCSDGSEGPPSLLAHPPPPPPAPFHLHPFISAIRDITGIVKNYLKNHQWILHGRVSYETVAISLLYLYSKSCVAIMQHRRATAASMFQNGISRNTKCDIMVSFPKSSHKLSWNIY